ELVCAEALVPRQPRPGLLRKGEGRGRVPLESLAERSVFCRFVVPADSAGRACPRVLRVRGHAHIRQAPDVREGRLHLLGWKDDAVAEARGRPEQGCVSAQTITTGLPARRPP